MISDLPASGDRRVSDLTDQQLVLEMCDRLGLKLGNPPESPFPEDEEYCRGKWNGSDVIRIGAGDGYCGFQVVFQFDCSGAFAGHAIVE